MVATTTTTTTTAATTTIPIPYTLYPILQPTTTTLLVLVL